jgi:hypothetical protein
MPVRNPATEKCSALAADEGASFFDHLVICFLPNIAIGGVFMLAWHVMIEG